MDSKSIITLLAFSSLPSIATAQCAAVENPNCANWVRNGFCNNMGYSKSMLQMYCPRSCPNSGCVSTTVVKSSAENLNCAKWANDSAAVFCASPVITKEMKSFYCPTTCGPELAEADDCAVYVQNGAKMVKTTAKADVNTAVKTAASTTNKILNVYVKATCKLSFYELATPTPPLGTDPHVKDYTGTTSQTFFRLTVPAEQTSGSFVCNCNP